MRKEHVIKILGNIDQDNLFYKKAVEALRILEEDKDYIVQYSNKGVKKDSEIRTMEEHIQWANPPYEAGGIHDQLSLVKNEKGLLYHLDVFPRKYHIYIVLNNKYEVLRLNIKENRPFDLKTGCDIDDGIQI